MILHANAALSRRQRERLVGLVFGGMTITAASVAGPIRLANLDMTTLKVTSGRGLQRIAVGRSIVLGSGHYLITMVGQAPDDNHLKLAVR